MEIRTAKLDSEGTLHITVSGHRFFAGEKYGFLERGWAVYCAEVKLPDEWMGRYGETLPAEEGWNEMSSRNDILVTSHPVLVALSLRAWWHRNGRPIPTAPDVAIPTFEEAVTEVRRREIVNGCNAHHAGTVPGLSRWKPEPS